MCPPELAAARTGAVVGVFVGGAGRRMGGRPKSELLASDTGERLIDRLARILHNAEFDVIVVGSHPGAAPLSADTVRVADEPSGIGPLGGLRALLRFADARPAIAIACDLPFVTADLVRRLAGDPHDAAVLAPREPEAGKWQPLFARYDPVRVVPVLERALADGVRSFQRLFSRLDVAEFALDDAERALLRDWDTPADVG